MRGWGLTVVALKDYVNPKVAQKDYHPRATRGETGEST